LTINERSSLYDGSTCVHVTNIVQLSQNSEPRGTEWKHQQLPALNRSQPTHVRRLTRRAVSRLWNWCSSIFWLIVYHDRRILYRRSTP